MWTCWAIILAVRQLGEAIDAGLVDTWCHRGCQNYVERLALMLLNANVSENLSQVTLSLYTAFDSGLLLTSSGGALP